jgi:hypothetical protein
MSAPSHLPHVVGLDLSLTGTGLAWVDDQGAGQLELITSKGDANATYPDRHARQNSLRDRIIPAVCRLHPELVLLEGPSYNSKDPFVWDRAGLWWRIYNELVDAQLALCVVPPATLKKYATGNGVAAKAFVVEEARHRFGHVWTGGFRGNDNLADAAVLCAIGHHGHVGRPLAQLPKTHVAALDGVAWPVTP